MILQLILVKVVCWWRS